MRGDLRIEIMKPLILLTLTVLIASAADDATHQRIIGTYKIVSGERSSKPIEDDKLRDIVVRITGNSISTYDRDDKEVYVATYQLDAQKSPPQITLTAKVPPEKARPTVSKGLIMHEADSTVKLIYALPDGPAPTEFKTREGQQMFVLQRTAPAESKPTTLAPKK